jgi:pteridine reductase
METTGRIALVTGGARRVGRAFSIALAEAGCDVVVNYNRSERDAHATVADIERLGRRAVALQADISDACAIRRMIEQTRADFGRLDILVNSASTFARAPVADITEHDWDHVLSVNLKGAFFLTQAAAPLMRNGDDAVVINIADLSALQPWPSYAHHAVSKAGLLHLTRVLARALAPEIRVNAISPGTILPPEDVAAEEGSERRVIRRDGEPSDVVAALLYLVRAGFVTGENLIVDGGRMLL